MIYLFTFTLTDNKVLSKNKATNRETVTLVTSINSIKETPRVKIDSSTPTPNLPTAKYVHTYTHFAILLSPSAQIGRGCILV